VNSDFTRQLNALLKERIEGFESLLSCDRLTAGANQETYRLRANIAGGEQQLALRRSVVEQDDASTVPSIGLDAEAALLELAAQAGIPVPKVHYVLRAEDELGTGFIMEWLEGETLGGRIVKAGELAEIRPRLAFQCGEILARIHAIETEAHSLDDLLPSLSPEQCVRQTWDVYQTFNIPMPMIDYAARWLLDNLPEHHRMTIVHTDFRNGNLMVTPTGINGVLDWELAHIGDPVRDLGWLCVNSWRFGQSRLPVGGFGQVEDLLAGYQSVSGINIDMEHLKFWQVFGSFWWAVTCLIMADSFRRGENTSLERPAIGRRSSEAQMDCVDLLLTGTYKSPVFDKTTRHQQLSAAGDMLASIASFLREDVSAEAQGRTRFLARVAANSLDIIERQLALAPALDLAESQRLADLLNSDGTLEELQWELVHQLRAAMPLNTIGLSEHLGQTVAGQLAIDQPGYSAFQSPAGE